MAIASKAATAAVIVVSGVIVWFYVGQDPQAFLEFVSANKFNLALAVQIGAMFILGITKHYIAGGILLITSLATLFGGGPMMEVIPVIAIVAVFGGQWFGSFIRARAHVMIPFNDPVSLLLIALAIFPLFVDIGLNEWWYWVEIAGFFSGYCKGYLSYGADVVYVAVHDLVRQEQEVYPIVRYTAPDGRMCWQPQSFRKVCRSMFLGIHNPLQMMPARNPRHVSVRNVLVRAEAYAYDMAHMESTITTVTKWRFKFEVESRKYVSAPHNMDSPYDWIANATGYEQLFLEYSKAQTESIERQVNLDVAALKGAKMVMEAMGSKTPNREMMDELGIDLEAALNRNMAKIKREATRKQKEEEDVGERVPPDHPDSR